MGAYARIMQIRPLAEKVVSAKARPQRLVSALRRLSAIVPDSDRFVYEVVTGSRYAGELLQLLAGSSAKEIIETQAEADTAVEEIINVLGEMDLLTLEVPEVPEVEELTEAIKEVDEWLESDTPGKPLEEEFTEPGANTEVIDADDLAEPPDPPPSPVEEKPKSLIDRIKDGLIGK